MIQVDAKKIHWNRTEIEITNSIVARQWFNLPIFRFFYAAKWQDGRPSLNAATHSNKRRRWKIESVTFWGNVKQFADVHWVHFEWREIQMAWNTNYSHISSRNRWVLWSFATNALRGMRFKFTLTTVQATTWEDTSIETEQRAEIRDFFIAATHQRETWKCIQYETDRRDGRYVVRMKNSIRI